MSYRELLELAARAYWGDEIDDVCSIEWSEADQSIAYTHADNQDHNGADQAFVWNPLADDGDRYRLAKKLKMVIDFEGRTVAYPIDAYRYRRIDWPNDEPDDSRAIVRAAAEIGKAMK